MPGSGTEKKGGGGFMIFAGGWALWFFEFCWFWVWFWL